MIKRQTPELSPWFRMATVFRSLTAVSIAASAIAGAAIAQDDPFALGVRNTEPLDPTAEQATFRLPEGFRIDLVAAEPEIAKPMNLAFDQRGRLWVSSSLEYPFAAKPGTTPRDFITIHEDSDGDGRFETVKRFAEGLNIPIGLYPWKDGVICFAIPNIMFLRDTDGDDKCDTQEILYGPFDTTRDTHGMCNAFRRGEDGWIYACHGFNNRSEVAGRDGNRVVMHSGNTFRFRPDGSRIEHYTIGQVNPFGMAIDHFGDPFTADCHTKPVTLLLQGGNYDSFGRPHDGLGYVPNVMEHLHGSTAIAGLALGEATGFPAEFQDSSFGGNVMTSRINRNKLVHIGSSVKAVEASDLLSTTDPWFRPVDLVAGPDGALYVADFYNRIIGHYEVDLYHPGRDRHRGRIWKISATSNSTTQPATAAKRVADLSVEEAVAELSNCLPERARLIADFLAYHYAFDAVSPLKNALTSPSATQRRRALRLLDRLNQLTSEELVTAAADPESVVRVHAFRVVRGLAERQGSGQQTLGELNTESLLKKGLEDADPMVRRAAVQASSASVHAGLIAPLMALYHQVPEDDVHLRHAIRMSLRDHLRNEEWFRTTTASLSAEDLPLIAGVCLALKSTASGDFIADHFETLSSIPQSDIAALIQYAASNVSDRSVPKVVDVVRRKFKDQQDIQLTLLESMRTGLNQRGLPVPSALKTWAQELAQAQLGIQSPDDLNSLQISPALSWSYQPFGPRPSKDNIWSVTRSRMSTDGVNGAPLFSSFEKGEQQTGVYRSEPFTLQEEFRFYAAGHNGFPDKPPGMKNAVRLRDAVTGELLREASPPRNDVAHPISWDVKELKGRVAVIELVDGDNGTAYAWMSVGRFSEPQLNPSDGPTRRSVAAQLVANYQLTALVPAMKAILRHAAVDRESQAACGAALAAMDSGARMKAVAGTLLLGKAPEESRKVAVDALCDSNHDAALTALSTSATFATSPEQLRLAEVLSTDHDGAVVLTSLIESGRMSARLLINPNVRQRLNVIADAGLKERIETLTASLPDESAALDELITSRRTSFLEKGGNAETGAELFRKHCAICHQVAGQGKKVGPNLDGIGNRGLDRMLEDVLAPNRNVDINFRTTTVVTDDGLALNGLARDLDGDQVSLTDSQGKETLIPVSKIDERVSSVMSPMPANVGELLTEEQFRDLVAWLMSLRH